MAETSPVRSEPHEQWRIAGYSHVSSTSISVFNWIRDIHTQDDSGISTCVAPAASVAATSSRYQASRWFGPLRLTTVLMRCSRTSAGQNPWVHLTRPVDPTRLRNREIVRQLVPPNVRQRQGHSQGRHRRDPPASRDHDPCRTSQAPCPYAGDSDR